MPHYSAYDSFKTKRSMDKKNRAKEKSFGKKEIADNNFVIKSSDDCGTVIEVRYDDAYVLYDNNIIVANLRRDFNFVCNQVLFPGDKVVIERNSNENIIINMVARTSLLSRLKKDSTRLDDSVGISKNIAANINLAVIVVSAKNPPLHPKFIDRYLMILQNNDIPAIICLNKCDLKTDEEDNILDIYKNIGITVIETSAYNNTGIVDLERHLIGKQAIFVGNSGVGKSTLINSIMENEAIKTSHISDKSKRGRHTTTTSKYYVWNDESSIIDTPGIRSLDVSSFNPSEIQDYFPEFNDWKARCKYNDCLHFNEPYESCLVKQGVASKIINHSRYESYLRIVGGLLGDVKTEEMVASISNEEKKTLGRRF